MKFYCTSVIVFILLFFPSCEKNFPSYNIVKNTAEFNLLCLGDSYTIGQGVPLSQSFPFQLLKNLKDENLIANGTYNLIAKTGWTTTELKEALQQNRDTSTYDIVTLLIGANNIFRNYPIEIYKTEFEQLLQSAIEKAGNQPEKVIVISIPDYGYTPFGKINKANISAEVDKYNAINKQLSLHAGARYVDITPISRQGLECPVLITHDKLHPSAIMYALWVELLIEEAKAIVK
jgi:lysophospholipase L1-like esterase